MGAPPFRVKAVYDYASPHDDDLSFPNGQVITVTDEEDVDWYFGEYVGSDGSKHQGLFPRNFVERCEPETPLRPSRSTRPKKELEHASDPKEPAEHETTEKAHEDARTSPVQKSLVDEPSIAKVPNLPADQSDSQPQVRGSGASEIISSHKAPTKPANPTFSKPKPSPVEDQPAVGSFRDRIAAFNKPAAPPVAPTKPSGLSQSGGLGFIKKPFVAPPPSKNAYVPPPREPAPQKVFRREEEMSLPTSNDPVDTGLSSPPPPPPTTAADADTEDPPKPTSLKERIALLQKQQMEQAARHAEIAQKKEKPRRPPKKRTDSSQTAGNAESNADGQDLETPNNGDTGVDPPVQPSHEVHSRTRSSTRRRKSKDATPATSPTVQSQEIFSDGNDADQSGAGDTEDGDDFSTGKDDIGEGPRTKLPALPQRGPNTPQKPPEEANKEERDTDEEEVEEEDDEEEGEKEDMDPEVKRRLEIRDRMAKMSGGMGMAGMFSPPGSAPVLSSRKQKTSGSSTIESTLSNSTAAHDSNTSQNTRMMALPGLQRVRSPEQDLTPQEVSKEEETTPTSIRQGRQPEEMPDMEDLRKEAVPDSQKSEESRISQQNQGSRENSMPVQSQPSRGVPPPLPNDLPVPPPLPVQSRPVPPPPSNLPPSLTNDSEPDEMLPDPKRVSVRTNAGDESQPTSHNVPPTSFVGPSPMLPSGPPKLQPPPFQHNDQNHDSTSNPRSPVTGTGPSPLSNRLSRMPPIPGPMPASPSQPQTRAPPPPPPTQASISRKSTGEDKLNTGAPGPQIEETEDEVTEYDGDYDTDIAPSISHKESVKTHGRNASVHEPTMTDETSYHQPGLPPHGSLQTPGAAPPRGLPPPPPNQPPKHAKKSSDMPRSAPPPPPTRPQEDLQGEDEEDYNLYSHASPHQVVPGTSASRHIEGPVTPSIEEEYDDLYSASPPRSYVSSPSVPASNSYASSPVMSPPERSAPRQSLDVLRHTTSNRRSMDAQRPSSEQGFIANDVDLGRASQWWTQRNVPPPVFRNRPDVILEIEESSTNQQGGPQIAVTRVYVLYMDYSQSVISARFEAQDPSRVDLQQHHEAPPARLRQDQLENAHSKFGVHIAQAAHSKHNAVVGDGTPFALVSELIRSFPDALPPVGSRAYGALVYANLANATVQQNDEIRAGDIVSFRNVKVQGHRGPMKQKYNMEVGKPDHVGIVVDWDGTKKKIRAWEQGRESKKVKIESFKLGDLRSGEVKVWRVMPKSWVGWDPQA